MLYTMQLSICALFFRFFSKYIMIQDFYPLHNHVATLESVIRVMQKKNFRYFRTPVQLQCATKGFIKCIVSDFQLNYGQNIYMLITLFYSRYFFFLVNRFVEQLGQIGRCGHSRKSWLRAVDKYTKFLSKFYTALCRITL